MLDDVIRAKSLIDDRFRELGSVEEVADTLDVSLETLRHSFRREVGVPPGEYLTAQRVAEAKRLLSETDLLAYEVGRAVGWKREDTAARAFRRATEMTMCTYRQAVRAGEA